MRSARPSVSSKPSRILRLFKVIVKSGTPAEARASWITWAVSASAKALSVPTVSKSHCTNSRNRPLGRPLTAEDRADRIPLERDAQLVDVLGHEPGQRHGQVEPQGELAGGPPFIGDVEDLAEDLVRTRPFPGQDFHPLDMRRLDRQISERGESLAEAGEHPLTRNHHRRGISRSPLATRGSIMAGVSFRKARPRPGPKPRG